MNVPPRSDTPADEDAGVDLRAPMADLPLRDVAGPPAGFPAREARTGLATMSDRALGAAADVAVSGLIVLAAILGAYAVVGVTPRFGGLAWASAFALYVSFFAITLPLLFFGRTVGMALAGLVARDDGGGRRLTGGQAARRWLGTLLTLAGLGLPLFWTARDPEAPTLADRLSRRTLVHDD